TRRSSDLQLGDVLLPDELAVPQHGDGVRDLPDLLKAVGDVDDDTRSTFRLSAASPRRNGGARGTTTMRSGTTCWAGTSPTMARGTLTRWASPSSPSATAT